MSRYIDAEYVNAFPIRIDHYDEEHGNRHFVLGIESVMEYIEEAPHIDIVRCKECRHWIGETEHYEDREYKACWQLCGQYMNSEFWCKYGEREGE